MIKELTLWNRFAAVAICGAVALAGCGGGGSEEAPADNTDAPAVEESAPAAAEEAAPSEETAAPAEEAAAPAESSDEAAVAMAGLTGKVTFEGTPPERTLIKAEGDAHCMKAHADNPLLSEQAVVSANGELANVFVYVVNAPAGAEAPSTPAVLDQVGCQYIPHVLGVMVGQELEIRNSDETTHNVRAVARKNRPINIAQPVGSPPRAKTFKAAEDAIRMKCDLHPWMTSFVFAMEHPYYGVSDASGNFAISGLPAGEYNVVAWHETFDQQEGTVTVDAEGNGTVNFTFSE